MFVGWAGTALQIVGASVLAFRLMSVRAAYWIMLPGSILWLGIAAARHDWALAVLQLFFVVINAVGLARWRVQ
jgi:hypothetical protein